MQPVWRKRETSNKDKKKTIPTYSDKVKQSVPINKNQTPWTDDMLSDHLPIYPINYEDASGYSIPKVLFDSIPPSVYCVLLGESTHGTHEFYTLRSFITKYLILHQDFTSIFLEMDFPKLFRLNLYVLGRLKGKHIDVNALFDDLKDYPSWMYRNEVIKELVIWLRNFNMKLKQNHKEHRMVTFYGIDMQSYDSLKVLKRLYNEHKILLPHSTEILSILNAIQLNWSHFTEIEFTENQINQVYEYFAFSKYELLQRIKEETHDTQSVMDLIYVIDQNIMTLQSAIYYFNNDCLWDIRDNHWFDTIEKYFYYKSNGKYFGFNCKQNEMEKGKIIVWAHNSHVVNAHFTNYSHSNIGALLKSRYGQHAVYTISFDSFSGTVTATNNRNESPQFFVMAENVEESYGQYLHQLAHKWKKNNLMVFLNHGIDKMKEMKVEIKPKYFVHSNDIKQKRMIRDIGVCYMWANPYNHCSDADFTQIADVVIFMDKTNALEPFDCDKHRLWDKYKNLWMHQNHDNQMNLQNDAN
eukprot:2785_1